ncbi:MFS transporter [Amycolatopsis sp. NPDC051045]|uniref:MFS transporter n=1 Tax=Amycolatopsis sp. NPDC051045 TaxID=3156922 RepID=UPI003412A438
MTATAVRPDAALWRLGGVLIMGAVLSILDATIVTVGIGSIARDLDSPLTTVQWVASAYLLAASAVIPLSGWLTDRFGGRAVWLWRRADAAGRASGLRGGGGPRAGPDDRVRAALET